MVGWYKLAPEAGRHPPRDLDEDHRRPAVPGVVRPAVNTAMKGVVAVMGQRFWPTCSRTSAPRPPEGSTAPNLADSGMSAVSLIVVCRKQPYEEDPPCRSPLPWTPTAVLGDDLVRVVKLLHHVRQQPPRQHPQVDPMAYPLLFNLKVAPLRVSALAEVLHSDVSTVSRQVSTLVDLGFVERGPDPHDGRAQALSLTAEGSRLLTAIREDRDRWLRPCSPTGPTTTSPRSAHTCVTSPPTSRPPSPPPQKERPMNDSTPPDTREAALATGGAPGTRRGQPNRTARPTRSRHRQILTILVGLMMGMFLAALDQTIVATAIRTIADDLHGLSPAGLGDHGVPDHRRRSRRRSTASSPTSTAASRSSCSRSRSSSSARCCARFADVDVPARGVPRGPGPRRRRPVLAGARDHRRHRAAARARQVPGLLPRRVRHRPACSARSSAASSPARRPSSASPAGAGSS